MSTAGRIVEALGGDKTLGRKFHTLEDLRQGIKRGLPFQAFQAMTDYYDLPRLVMSRVLRTPERTLVRRKHGARFLADESDRLVRVARIAALAEDVLGRRDRAGRWLQKENRALGGDSPLEHLDTELGARDVEQVLGRIGHGIIG